MEDTDMSMLDAVRSLLTSDLVSRVATKTGESDVAVSKGLGAVLPMLLASLAGRSDDSSFMNQFATLASRTADVDVTSPANTWANISSVESAATAQSWLKSLFGDNLPAVVSGLSRYAGVKSSTSSSLFTMAMPLLLSFFGKMMRTENVDAVGLADRLRRERKSFAAAVPSDLEAYIPGTVRTAETTARTVTDRDRVVIPPDRYADESPAKWLLPVILGALALSGLLWWWGHERTPHQARNASADYSNRAAVGTAGVTDYLTKKLPDNVMLRVPKDGMEDHLTDYLGTAPAVRTERTFDFDRIGFDTASAALTSESREQIRNIASILRAYPNTTVTIAGFTDNVGDENSNLQLSRTRAEMVTNALRGAGIAADRIQARGFGSASPIASNDTADGRAKNRRVTLMVNQ